MGVPPVRLPTDPVQWRGAVDVECERCGRILVDPHRYGLSVILRGQQVRPGPDEDASDPRTWYVRRYGGHKGRVHVSVWQVPRVLGAAVLWDHDDDGEIAFRREVAVKILGGIDPQVAESVRIQAEQVARRLEMDARLRPVVQPAADAARAALTPTSKEA